METQEISYARSFRVRIVIILQNRVNEPHSHVSEHQRKRLYIIETAFRTALVAVVFLATELTISWNKIHNVDTTKTAGQLIPLILSVGGAVHLLLVADRSTKHPAATIVISQQKQSDTIDEEKKDPSKIIVHEASVKESEHEEFRGYLF